MRGMHGSAVTKVRMKSQMNYRGEAHDVKYIQAQQSKRNMVNHIRHSKPFQSLKHQFTSEKKYLPLDAHSITLLTYSSWKGNKMSLFSMDFAL